MTYPDDEVVVGGGAFSQRVTRGEKVRPPKRTDAEHRQRVLDGTAWREFCRALERTGNWVLEADVPNDDRTRAEGFRYVMGLVETGVRIFLEMDDPEYPYFSTIETPWAKFGADNTDNKYLHTFVRGDRTYRIRGQRGTCVTFVIQAFEGIMHLGDSKSYGTMHSDDLEIAADGSFEIIMSRKPHPGNWFRLHENATMIAIREYFNDWENEEPARFSIECVETVGRSRGPTDPATVGRDLDMAGLSIETLARFWGDWMPDLRATQGKRGWSQAVPFIGGVEEIRYGNNVYDLGPTEALILQSEKPDARFWHYMLCNPWFVTMDIANRTNSINGHQAYIGADGRFYCVVAHRDPGCPNWLDTGGEQHGLIQCRYLMAKNSPEASVVTVPFDEVWQHLPQDMPRVTPEQRRDQIAARQRGFQRRFRR